MTDTTQLRTVITGLLGFAATEEQMLLGAAHRSGEGDGTPECWATAPLVAHNTESKLQQLQRLQAVIQDETPPEFAEIDHLSGEVYGRFNAQPAAAVAAQSLRTTGELITAMRELPDDDLLDPVRHPWLNGRQLWLQVIVRGFWHPCGHVAEWYLSHGQADRAVAMLAHGVLTAGYLRAPDPARGMAAYNLACAQARAGSTDDAVVSLIEAIRFNPDLKDKAGRDTDLAVLRSTGSLDAVLAPSA